MSGWFGVPVRRSALKLIKRQKFKVTGPAVAVAAALNVIVVAFTTVVIVAPAGIPGPETVITPPPTIPVVLVTVTVVLRFVVFPLTPAQAGVV